MEQVELEIQVRDEYHARAEHAEAQLAATEQARDELDRALTQSIDASVTLSHQVAEADTVIAGLRAALATAIPHIQQADVRQALQARLAAARDKP